MTHQILEFIRHYVLSLSALGRFALTLVMLATIPRLCRRAHVPAAVGLLLSGVIVCVSACKFDPLSRGIGVQN